MAPLSATKNVLRCEPYYNPLLRIRQSPGGVVLGAIQMFQRAQIERLKFGGLRNKHLIGCVAIAYGNRRKY
jgi:hypothetical protein